MSLGIILCKLFTFLTLLLLDIKDLTLSTIYALFTIIKWFLAGTNNCTITFLLLF